MAPDLKLLSDRELEIARLIAQGHTNTGIAVELNLRHDMLGRLIDSIYAKLECPVRVNRRAWLAGWLPPPVNTITGMAWNRTEPPAPLTHYVWDDDELCALGWVPVCRVCGNGPLDSREEQVGLCQRHKDRRTQIVHTLQRVAESARWGDREPSDTEIIERMASAVLHEAPDEETAQALPAGPAPADLGARIAYRRRALGLSQSELAAQLDRSESWMSQIERGVRVIDRVSVLQGLMEVLGDDLMEESDRGSEG